MCPTASTHRRHQPHRVPPASPAAQRTAGDAALPPEPADLSECHRRPSCYRVPGRLKGISGEPALFFVCRRQQMLCGMRRPASNHNQRHGLGDDWEVFRAGRLFSQGCCGGRPEGWARTGGGFFCRCGSHAGWSDGRWPARCDTAPIEGQCLPSALGTARRTRPAHSAISNSRRHARGSWTALPPYSYRYIV